MTDSRSLTAALAEFASTLRLQAVPPDVRTNAKLLLLDTLGVALAAFPERLGQTIVQHVQSLGGQPESTVVGGGFRTSPPLAALANGTLTSAMDFDAGFHFTTHGFPACLALGEKVGASGAEVLEALIVSYEIAARLTSVVDADRERSGGLTARGWYHVGLVGPLVSALAAGRLLRLDPSNLMRAVGIAAATAGGVRRNFGTMAKAFQAGNAASAGVHAAMLAGSGFTSDPGVLQAPLGLFGALGLPLEDGEQPDLDPSSMDWTLLAPLRIKRFPACTPAHRPIQAVLDLQRRHGFAGDDIERIDADLHTFSLLRLEPADEVEAGFSLPFLLAVAILDREVGLDQMHPERVHDPRVKDLLKRVRPLADTSPSGREDEGERVVVTLKNGAVLTGTVDRINRLDDRTEIEEKFRTCSSRVLPARSVEVLLEETMQLEDLATIGQLMSATFSGES